MKRIEYDPYVYKDIIARLLDENKNICGVKDKSNNTVSSPKELDQSLNFDQVFKSFVDQFPFSRVMSEEDILHTFKVLLQDEIDNYWYSSRKRYTSNLEVLNDETLINLNEQNNNFKYLKINNQSNIVIKLKKIWLKIINSPLKYSPGLLFPYASIQVYNFLNKIYLDLGIKVVVKDIIRSEEYQKQLNNESPTPYSHLSHLYGYAIDIEQLWYKKYKPKYFIKINNYLKELENLGHIIYVDNGKLWHICLSPYLLDNSV